MKDCPKCGGEVDDEGEICPECFTLVSVTRQLKHINGKNLCPECRKPLRKAGADLYICPHCTASWNAPTLLSHFYSMG